MGSAVPHVIDYLVAVIGALPVCAPPVRVVDGYVAVDAEAAVVSVAGFLDDSETTSVAVASQYRTLGTGLLDEQFTIPIYVDVFAETSQKTVRDMTYVIVDAILAAIRADLTFGGLVGPIPPLIAASTLQQTRPDDAPAGRRCTVLLELDCQARI